MNRRSLIKCILGLAAAPKILAELDFNPPLVAVEKEVGFIGLIPTILNGGTVVEYRPGNFTLKDFNDLIRQEDMKYRSKIKNEIT